MEILFLGTAAAEGWPAVFCHCVSCERARQAGDPNIRTRASALVDGRFKFDLGPDTYHQALTFGVDLGSVRYVLVTHTHADHYYAQELEMRQPPFAHPASGQTDPGLDVYGNRQAVEIATQLGVAVAVDTLPAASASQNQPLVRIHEVSPFAPFSLADAEVVALKADHKPDETALFYLFHRGGRTLLYALDTGYFPEATWNWLESESGRGWITAHGGIHLAVLDCTGGPMPGNRSRGHMNITTDLEVQQRLQADGLLAPQAQFVATHFSHNGGLLHHELAEAFRRAGAEFTIAHDGLRLVI